MGGEDCVAESNPDRGEEIIREDNASKDTIRLIVDEKVECSGKTALCNEIEGGTRGDEGERVKAKAEGSDMYGNTDLSKIT